VEYFGLRSEIQAQGKYDFPHTSGIREFYKPTWVRIVDYETIRGIVRRDFRQDKLSKKIMPRPEISRSRKLKIFV